MFFKNNVFGIIWTIFIVVICGIPGDKLPESSFFGDLPIDKLVHGALYFILYLFVYTGLTKSSVPGAKLVAILYCIILGVLVEWLQTNYFKKRSGDLYDVLANSAGVFIGVFSYNLALKTLKKFQKTGKDEKNEGTD